MDAVFKHQVNEMSTISLTMKVIDIALLDAIERKYPLTMVALELNELGLRTDEAVELIKIHLRERGVI